MATTGYDIMGLNIVRPHPAVCPGFITMAAHTSIGSLRQQLQGQDAVAEHVDEADLWCHHVEAGVRGIWPLYNVLKQAPCQVLLLLIFILPHRIIHRSWVKQYMDYSKFG